RLYKGSALILLNVLVLYVLLNVFLAVSFRIHDAWKERSDPHAGLDPVTINYGPEVLDRVYPGWDRRERTQMLAENWNRRFVHEDYTHFRERPFSGKYVHVSEAGYRHSKNQGPWPPSDENLNIFCFGGSTMFGYGLPDDQTVASCLQESLAAQAKRRVCVY